MRALQRIISSSEANENRINSEEESSSTRSKEKSLSQLLRFAITSMQLLCQFANQHVMKSLTDPIVFIEFFAAITPFVDLCEKLEAIFKKKSIHMSEVININGRIVARPSQASKPADSSADEAIKPYSSKDRVAELATDT